MATQTTTRFPPPPPPSSKKGSDSPRLNRAQIKNRILLESVKSVLAFLPSGVRDPAAAGAGGAREGGATPSRTPPSSGYTSESPDA